MPSLVAPREFGLFRRSDAAAAWLATASLLTPVATAAAAAEAAVPPVAATAVDAPMVHQVRSSTSTDACAGPHLLLWAYVFKYTTRNRLNPRVHCAKLSIVAHFL